MSDAECIDECSFCVIHQYGVYILNIGGILILSLVVCVYWKEVRSYFRGKSPSMKSSVLDARPTSPDLSQFPTTKTQDSFQIPISSNMGPDQKDLTTPSPALPAIPAQPRSPQRVAPRQYLTQQQLIPRQVSPPTIQMTRNDQNLPGQRQFPQIFPKQPPVVVVTNPPTPVGKSNTPVIRKSIPPTQVPYDKFKLPTKVPGVNVDAHESTGSNYYKEITRGKKPVASISQYLLKKNLGKKGKRTPIEPKRHHHHHKNHHRNQKDGLENIHAKN